MRILTAICLIIALGVFSCRSDKPAVPPPAPVEHQAEPAPDVIRIAVWFVQFEGIGEELTVGSGRVVSQDREAYYVGFQRKATRPHRVREVVVKVYKRNGLAEWEEY
ncbi:MAG: hypothetical protein JXD23_13815 [Spirochaetales bacterium]|nr:hypothetical protein [Spirochaetales bacterium]